MATQKKTVPKKKAAAKKDEANNPRGYLSENDAQKLLFGDAKKSEEAGALLDDIFNVRCVPTGHALLDAAIGCFNPGIPRGVQVEVFGPEASGKSLLTSYLASRFQQYEDPSGLYWPRITYDADFEGGKIGQLPLLEAMGYNIRPPRCKYVQPDANIAEPPLDEIWNLIQKGAIDNFIVDSLASMMPKEAADKDLSDTEKLGVLARLMHRTMRRFSAACRKKKVTGFWVNHELDIVGGKGGKYCPGGRAMRFYPHLRMRITPMKLVTRGEEILGSRCRLQVVKNRFGKPFQSCVIVIDYRHGIDPLASVLETCKDIGWISPGGGGWYDLEKLGFPGEKAQGDLKLRAFFAENEERRKVLDSKINAMVSAKITENAADAKVDIAEEDEESDEVFTE